MCCPRNTGATRVFPTAAANNFLPHCETLLLCPGQNKVRYNRYKVTEYLAIFTENDFSSCRSSQLFFVKAWTFLSHCTGVDLKREINIVFSEWQDEEKWAGRFWHVGCWHCIKEGGGLYKEPLKRSKNVVIVNNGTYGPDHNSHSMIYGNLRTGSFDLLHLASVFGRYFDRFEIVNSVVSNDND